MSVERISKKHEKIVVNQAAPLTETKLKAEPQLPPLIVQNSFGQVSRLPSGQKLARSTNSRRVRRWTTLIVILVILIGGGLATLLLNILMQHYGHTTDIQRPKSITSTSTVQQSPTASTQASLPEGKELYSTKTPAPPGCNTTDSDWSPYEGTYDCYLSAIHISDSSGPEQLGGILLSQLPNGQSYPDDYVVQAHIESLNQRAFGLYFRNQGNYPLGTYAFLVSPDGTWQANVYGNTTKQLTEGIQAFVSGTGKWVTLAVIVKGTNFSFYINNTFVGATHDSTYSSGIAGIAVDHNNEIATDQFSFYTVKS